MRALITTFSFVIAPILSAADVAPLPGDIWQTPLPPEHYWQAAPELELNVSLDGGWNPGYLLEINFDNGEVHYTPLKESQTPQRHKLQNFKEVGSRVKALVEHVPNGQVIGQWGEDIATYSIAFRNGRSLKKFIVMPGAAEARTLLSLLDEIVASLKKAQ